MTKKQSKPEPSKVEQFKALTWIELTNWAGSTIVSRGKTYQQGKRVSQLAKTPDGKLVAWVKGTDIYATQVEINANGSLDSNCSCPYWATCKHAVAVVLEYLEHVKKGKNVPFTDSDDQRLSQRRSSWDDDDMEYSEEKMTTTSIFREYLAPYLQKVQTLLQEKGRKKEWEVYLQDLRIAHARKRRLLEVLDGLGGKRIID
ncbi:MAG: SWIM zinc finger family protein [Thiomargarita sp.]|nr:SWIM zinc finger family protein [Thiomargarita sp.]